MKKHRIQWHSGFVAAINLELSANRADLVYEREYNLNTKPLEIDLLVIKKDSSIQISNEIGRLFLGHNILEYKSPEDHLNIDTLYKISAYACLYKSYGETLDERKADDITVTLVREARPKGLFQYFKAHNIQMSNPYGGIYYVSNGVLFPTQIIVTGELDSENHAWLKSLSNKLKKQEMNRLLAQADTLTQKFDKELASAVLEVSVQANQQIAKELRGEKSMNGFLLEFMRPEMEKMVEEMRDEVTEQVREHVREQMKDEVTEQVRQQVKDEMTEQVRQQVKDEVREQVKDEVKEQVRAELTEQVTQEITQQVTQQTALETASKMLRLGKLSVEEIKECIPKLSLEQIRALKR